MRVLVVDPIFSSLPYDQALCAALVEEGHQVKIVGRALRSSESWTVPAVEHVVLPIEDVIRATRVSGVLLRFYTLVRHVRYSLQIQKVERIVRAYQPDIVHFQWCLTPLAEARLVDRLRRHAVVLLTVHDTNPFNGSRVSSLVTRGLHRLMTRFDRLVVHTQAAANVLMQRGFRPERLSVVPHGLLQTRVAFHVPTPDAMLAEGEQTFVTCLLFGHLKHYKGIDVLIRAVTHMPNDVREGMRFVVAGQLGVDFSELRRLCEVGGVAHLFRFELRFLPEAEIDAVMRAADIFVFPYREIQASGVFTLALQYGRPIIASKLGIFAERIGEGVNGILVPPEDHVALARALERLFADAPLRRSMAEANLAASRDYPSWTEIARLTTKSYEMALMRERPALGSGV